MLLPRTTADQMRVSGTKADDRSGASAAGAPTARSSLRRTYLFSALWLALCWILYSAFTGDMAQNGTCGCEMAYMWPSYRLIEWEGSAREQYAVHLYREGHTDPAGAPSGVPVLFLPGNAGAYQQGRSVAASAATLFYRPSQNPIGAGASWRRPLDFFVFDFNEEFSALHAPTLDAQADFVAAAVPHILESYAGSEKPTRILLLGHSMGGIVARLAAQRMDNSSIDAIVTMSTPHDMPPVALDAEMDALYTRLNSASYANPSPPLVSLCGGVADTQIVSDNCALPASLAGPEDGFAVFSTAVPGVWTGVEHQVMVWCDQVRWRVARALLDMADARARSARLVAARKWLLPHSEATHSTDAIIDAHHDVTVTSERMTLLVHLVQPTPAALVDPPVRVQHCEGDTCSPAKWIACAVPRTRDAAAPFPFPGEGVTAADSMLVVDVTDIPVRGHLRVELPANSKVAAGGFESFDGIHGSWDSAGHDLAHVELTFERPVSSLLAYKLQTDIGTCSGPPPVIHHEALPAPGYATLFESRFYPNPNAAMTLHSHISGAPFHGTQQMTRGVRVHIYQQRGCTVKHARLSLDIMATIAKAMQRFRIAAVTWCSGWVAVLLVRQLAEYHASGVIPALGVVVENTLQQNLAIVLAVIVFSPLVQGLLGLFVPNEQLFLGSSAWSLVWLYPIIALASFGLVLVVSKLLAAMVSLTSYILWRRPTPEPSSQKAPPAKATTRWLSRAAMAGGFLLLVKLFIPWRMAFVMLYLIQFQVVAQSARDEQLSKHRLQATMLLLMTFLLPLTVPALAVWGRNLWLRNGHSFASDHAVLPVLPVLLAVQLGSSSQPPSRSRIATRAALAAAGILAITAFLLSARRPYTLLSASNLVFLALAALFAPPLAE